MAALKKLVIKQTVKIQHDLYLLWQQEKNKTANEKYGHCRREYQNFKKLQKYFQYQILFCGNNKRLLQNIYNIIAFYCRRRTVFGTESR